MIVSQKAAHINDRSDFSDYSHSSKAKDPEVAVLALDFELGYGSHENPVGVLAEALKEAKAIAKADGRELAIIGYVLGTEEDPQDIHEQRKILEDLEVLVVDSSHQLCEATKTL